MRVPSEAQITALLISPNRDLAQQFVATLAQTKAFQILADLKSYLPRRPLKSARVNSSWRGCWIWRRSDLGH